MWATCLARVLVPVGGADVVLSDVGGSVAVLAVWKFETS